MDRLPRCNFNNFELWLESSLSCDLAIKAIFSSKFYLAKWHHFSLLSESYSDRHSDENIRYIVAVAGPFKLIF